MTLPTAPLTPRLLRTRHSLPLLRAGAAIFALLFLAACGPDPDASGQLSVGAGNSAAASAGSVSIFITDAPSDEFDQILVTITELQLIGAGGPVTIFSGTETIDLKDLENFSDLFVFADQVPVGVYEKIRMHVSRIQLKRDGDVPEVVEVEIPASGRIDLETRERFRIREGVNLVIELDMDARKSIHLIETGGPGGDRYMFRPVVFVTIGETNAPARLARVHGEITEIIDDGTFELCSTLFMASRYAPEVEPRSEDGGLGDRHRCMTVELDDETGLFDANGEPTDPGSLELDAEVTVVGRFHIVDGNHDDSATPLSAQGREHRDHYHSSDMGDGRSHGDTDTDTDSDTDSDSDTDGGGRPEPPPVDLVLLAFVVEIGPAGSFLTLGGIIDSDVDDAGIFDFALAPGQGFGQGSVVSALLQQGTRIFTRKGYEVDETEIIPDTDARIDGVFSASPQDDTLYRTALLLLDIDPEFADELRGPIVRIDDSSRRLSVDVVGEDGTPTGEECVDVPERARIFLIPEASDRQRSIRISFEDLEENLYVEVYGGFEVDRSCFVADTILGFPDQNPPLECSENADCAQDEFCSKDLDSCDLVGQCEVRPELCTLEYDPVCGCDGQTYGNDCEAAGAGVSIANEGACVEPAS